MTCPHVWVPAIEVGDMFDDIFAPIARDGAGMLEIQLRLQKAFVALVAADSGALGDAAKRHSATALKRAEVALTLEDRAARCPKSIIADRHHIRSGNASPVNRGLGDRRV